MHSGDDDTREFFHVLVALFKERLKHFNLTHTSRHTEKWTHTFTISNKDTTLNIDRLTSGLKVFPHLPLWQVIVKAFKL